MCQHTASYQDSNAVLARFLRYLTGRSAVVLILRAFVAGLIESADL